MKRQSPILDRWGKPINIDLEVPQTKDEAALAHLQSHYGGHPSSGLTPGRIAAILKDAERGNLIAQCELAEDMEEKDAHIQSELGKRRLALMSVPWNITAPPGASAEEKRDAEMIESLLRSATWLDDAIFDAADAILKGFSNQELHWDYIENTHVIVGCEWADPSWFQVHPNERNQLMLRDGSHTGMALRQFGWLSHRAKSKSGYITRTGLARVLAWPYLFKNYSVRDLAEFLEIYGLPLRIGKYPEGASQTEKATLLRAVMSIGHNAGGIIPKGMEIEFEKAADGASDPFMAMVAWAEKSQSKAILGGTLTSQADGKSSTNALGNVHNDVREDIRNADLKALQNSITRDIIYPLYALNCRSYQSPHRHPRFEFDTSEAQDLSALTSPLKTLVELGIQIPQSWIHEKGRIPMPANNEPVLTLQAVKTEPVEQLRGVAVLKADVSTDDQTAIEHALNALSAGELNTDMVTVLKPLLDLAEQDPDGLGVKLGTIWPQMDDQALTERIAQVMFVAELWGQVNAEAI